MLVSKIKFSSGEVLEIHQDEDPVCPRRDSDNLGTMICFHRRYNLGDEHEFSSVEDFNPQNHALCLPLYLYDHSGITMSTEPFNCRWDSGQVGWIYVTEDQLKNEYSDCSEESIEKARAVLLAEVACYDQFLTGQVYGFVLRGRDEEVDDERDSCWGFFGDDLKNNGVMDHLPERLAKQYEDGLYTEEWAD